LQREEDTRESGDGIIAGADADAATAAAALVGLESRALWNQFEALTKIARPLRREGSVIGHVRTWAAENGVRVKGRTTRVP
jgi:hypothetical protein